MKLKHPSLIILAGSVWLVIGIFLLSLGIHFMLGALEQSVFSLIERKFSLVSCFETLFKDRTQTTIVIITCALLLGYLKGRMVLAKSVKRQIKRIETLPNPSPLKHLYGKGYYLLIAVMISLGMSLRFLPISLDTRGAVDIVIGSALINGSMLYFRYLLSKKYLIKRKEA